MVIALLALGLVMILGGIAAVVQGFPYVRLESGLAMVIGGTTAASAGAVILGLAAIVLRMKRLESAIIAARFTVQGAPFDQQLASVAPLGSDNPVAPAIPVGAGLGGASVGDVFARNLAEADTPPIPDIEPEDRIGTRMASAAEPWLPQTQIEAEPPSSEPEEPTPAAEALDTARPERESGPEVSLRPSLDPDAPLAPAAIESGAAPAQGVITEPKAEQAASEQAEAEPAKADQPADSPLEVIGTYSSGGNTYAMFADGTIEAETPRGRFNFNSLEELKDFVDSGGEHETRGAA